MHDEEHSQDDSPLYIFDGSFAEKRSSKGMRQHYQVPPHFAEDLMQWGGEKRRPPYRYHPTQDKWTVTCLVIRMQDSFWLMLEFLYRYDVLYMKQPYGG